MGDLIYLALVVGFFVLAAGLVHACERIVGTGEFAVDESVEPSAPADVDRSEVRA